MRQRKDCDFSYAGLKNAFRLAVQQAIEAHTAAEAKDKADTNAAAAGNAQGPAGEAALAADLSVDFSVDRRYASRQVTNVEELSAKLPMQVRSAMRPVSPLAWPTMLATVARFRGVESSKG
jgi:hypothetical protein